MLSITGVKTRPGSSGTSQAEVVDATMLDEDDFTFGEEGDEGYDDVIEVDSD